MNRRQFATSLGASLILAPFINFLNGTSRADSKKGAKRLIVFFCPNGTVHKFWRPSGTETSFIFPAASVLEPLTPHQKDVIVLEGIDFIGVNNHEAGMHNMLTAGGDVNSIGKGASVDQFVASALGQTTRFPSLEFGVETSAWGGNVQTRMSYSAPGSFVTPEDNPVAAFNRLFAAGDADAARLLRRRKSTLDLIRAEIADLETRLGSQERQKLDQHLDALRRTEQGLGVTAGCTPPAAPMALDNYDHHNFPTIGKSHMDLLVTALSCDMTRVASIQYSHTVGPHVFSWVGQSQGHHDLSHIDDSNTAGVANFIKCENWYAQQFAYLLSRLKATPELAGGTLFDNTLVVWAKELGDSRLHTCQSVPWVLAGGGGYFRTGRYLKYQGAPHQQLLTSVCQAVGMTNDRFGDATRGTGPLPGLV